MVKQVLKVRFRLFAAIALVFVLNGCIGSTYRSGRVLDPKQLSVGGSYVYIKNVERADTDPTELIALDGRVGITKGLDAGIMQVWDKTKDMDGMLASFWGDFKIQLWNLENRIGHPFISLGLQKGYAYHEFAKLHVTTLPIIVTLPVEERSSAFFMYKHELFSDDFMPSSFENPRSTFLIGMEAMLRQPRAHQFVPKLGISFGTFNSLIGGEGDRGLIFNVGLCVDSPKW